MTFEQNKALYEKEKDISWMIFSYKETICLVERHPHMHHLCGYVGVPKDHRFYEEFFGDIMEKIKVNNELTWSNFKKDLLAPYNELYFIGFDCAHFSDWVPSRQLLKETSAYNAAYDNIMQEVGIDKDRYDEKQYRDIPYVIEGCKQLRDALY